MPARPNFHAFALRSILMIIFASQNPVSAQNRCFDIHSFIFKSITNNTLTVKWKRFIWKVMNFFFIHSFCQMEYECPFGILCNLKTEIFFFCKWYL